MALLRTRDCNLVARSSVSWRFWALEIAICYVSRLQSRGASWHSCRAFPPSSSEPSPNKEGNAGQTLRSRFHIRNRFQRADRFQRSRQRSGDLSGQSLLGRSIGAISGDLSGQSREIYRGNLGRSIGAISGDLSGQSLLDLGAPMRDSLGAPAPMLCSHLVCIE